MIENYPYSARNRILKPCFYMYTPFEGVSFFKHFFSLRKKCLIKLENKVLNHQDMAIRCKQIFAFGFSQLEQHTKRVEPKLRSRLKYSFPLTKLREQAFRCIPSRPGNDIKQLRHNANVHLKQNKPVGDIDTMGLLLDLFKAITNEDTVNEAGINDWLSWLVKRFEVTKRLYTRYPSGSKKVTERYDRIILYALFAFLLSHHCGKNGNLKYLNTLLKLNDLICSVLESVIHDQVISTAAYFSMALEHIYVHELIAHKGLNL